MSPPSNDLLSNNPPSRRHSAQFSNSRMIRNTGNMSRSTGVPARLRNDDSWVEISSQPSSSSLSSIGEEVITTGLRAQKRRRRHQHESPAILEARQTSTSSQEEYEESESEEDHVMTSSNEHIVPATTLPVPYDSGSDSDDDDEQATALGRRTEPTFTPQPNAFSHPPFSQRSAPGSYFPPHANTRPTNPYRVPSRQQSLNNHHADQDAALRASLTTLLSIGAAAARGLPKRNQGPTTATSNEPMALRFIPESELMAPAPANPSRPLSPSTRPASTPSISSEESKRKASSPKPAGEKSRALKKKRIQAVGEETLLSPTFLTWVMSAGVVILVSVVGFGAGYVIGREVGRQETMMGLNGSTVVDANSCGREAVRGSTGSLRRFKWGISGAARAVAA